MAFCVADDNARQSRDAFDDLLPRGFPPLNEAVRVFLKIELRNGIVHAILEIRSPFCEILDEVLAG